MPECVHHWAIEIADGPTSVGRCRRCKEVREFANSIRDNVYNHRGQWAADPAHLKRPGPAGKLP